MGQIDKTEVSNLYVIYADQESLRLQKSKDGETETLLDLKLKLACMIYIDRNYIKNDKKALQNETIVTVLSTFNHISILIAGKHIFGAIF